MVREQVEKAFTFLDFSGKDEEIQRIKCYEMKERENTETPEHHPSRSNKAGFRWSYSNNKKTCRNKCDMKTKCRLR